MNGRQIRDLLIKDWSVKQIFRGVFSSDGLPKQVRKGVAHAFVINTDPHDKPGAHWVALYVSAFGRATYFDSFGMLPFPQTIADFLTYNQWTLRSNPVTLQSFDTSTCGLYCVLFIKYMCRGESLQNFLNLFKPHSPAYNDRKIRSLCQESILRLEN